MSNRIVLFVNHVADKTKFDRIAIHKNDGKFTISYIGETTMKTLIEKTPVILDKDSHHDVLDYVEDVLDLMMNDIDVNPYASIDVCIPCIPIVALHPKNSAVKNILMRAIRTWATC